LCSSTSGRKEREKYKVEINMDRMDTMITKEERRENDCR